MRLLQIPSHSQQNKKEICILTDGDVEKMDQARELGVLRVSILNKVVSEGFLSVVAFEQRHEERGEATKVSEIKWP